MDKTHCTNLTILKDVRSNPEGCLSEERTDNGLNPQ
jgi:hypothetical protein